MTPRLLCLALLPFAVASIACDSLAGARETAESPPRLLVFSRTLGFRHASIPAAIQAVEGIARAQQMIVEATEDPTWFADTTLARFDAVVFLMTTGDVLDAAQQSAFERFVRAGGGFVGVHSASDTEYDWAWYGGLVGAYFASHPAVQPATVHVVTAAHPSLLGVPTSFTRSDEWYDFVAPPSPLATILLRVDEASYSGGQMGAVHPIAWAQPYDGGRAWYTGMGHTEASYAEPVFVAHLTGGLLWAVGRR